MSLFFVQMVRENTRFYTTKIPLFIGALKAQSSIYGATWTSSCKLKAKPTAFATVCTFHNFLKHHCDISQPDEHNWKDFQWLVPITDSLQRPITTAATCNTACAPPPTATYEY